MPHDQMTEGEHKALINQIHLEYKGKFKTPLPGYAERRRIRVAAEWTQQDLADEMDVSRTAIVRFEQKAGFVGDRRLPGREPSGDTRTKHAKVLKRLDRGEDPYAAAVE